MTATEKHRILVTVKTYPTLSRKYGETVCTAGVREDGTWLRLYPVPFRRLEEAEQYHKFDWIECRLKRRASDPRPESFSPVDFGEFTPVGHIGTSDRWNERRRILLKTARVYDTLSELIAAAKENAASLAVFKPTRVTDFIWENDDRDWSQERLDQMRALHSQLALFEDDPWRKTFQLIKKLPYAFSYRFEDATGRSSELQVLDWEVGALYWNCLKSTNGDESEALAKVRGKYYQEFLRTDLHFFLGTTQRFHQVGPNPWVIIGVFPIPHDPQQRLFD